MYSRSLNSKNVLSRFSSNKPFLNRIQNCLFCRINDYLLYWTCSRKNFVFLFGAFINLTVRVDAYFHPIRMTYPIQSRPFFQAAPKHFLFLRTSSTRTDAFTVCSLDSSSIITPWGKPSNVCPLKSILLDQWFPIDYELGEFNPPHAGTTLRHLQNWLCRLRRKIRSDIQLLHPGATFSGDIHASPPNNQDHTPMGDYVIRVLNQQTRLLLHLWRPYLTHTFHNALT